MREPFGRGQGWPDHNRGYTRGTTGVKMGKVGEMGILSTRGKSERLSRGGCHPCRPARRGQPGPSRGTEKLKGRRRDRRAAAGGLWAAEPHKGNRPGGVSLDASPCGGGKVPGGKAGLPWVFRPLTRSPRLFGGGPRPALRPKGEDSKSEGRGPGLRESGVLASFLRSLSPDLSRRLPLIRCLWPGRASPVWMDRGF